MTPGKPRGTEGEIEELGGGDGEKIAGHPIPGQQQPNEQQAGGGIDDIVPHIGAVLPYPLQHAIHEGIHIHDRHQRRQKAYVLPGGGLGIDELARGWAKKKQAPATAIEKKSPNR